MSKYFLDTNVIVDYAKGRPGPRLEKIQAMMENFVNKVDTAVVTSFVIAELRTTIRKKALLNVANSLQPGQSLTTELKNSAIEKADKVANGIIEDLLKSRRVVQLKDPTNSSTFVFQKALDIVEHNPGDAWIQDHCEVCKASPVKFTNYKYLSAADALHASCASVLNCEVFATGEKSFRALEGSGDVPNIDFKVID